LILQLLVLVSDWGSVVGTGKAAAAKGGSKAIGDSSLKIAQVD
jgi:hypothetical protein